MNSAHAPNMSCEQSTRLTMNSRGESCGLRRIANEHSNQAATVVRLGIASCSTRSRAPIAKRGQSHFRARGAVYKGHTRHHLHFNLIPPPQPPPTRPPHPHHTHCITTPMAVALHAKILAEGYTPRILRAAGAATGPSEAAKNLHQQLLLQLITPQKLVAPQPQKQRADFAQILEWEQKGREDVVVAPPAGGHNHRTQRPQVSVDRLCARTIQTDIPLQPDHEVYIESVLAQSRARLRRREFDFAWTKASRRTTSTGANPWPPSPSQPASAHTAKHPSAAPRREVDPSHSNHLPPQLTARPEYADVLSIGDIEGLGARPGGSPSHFIDSDGLEWPIPLRECFASPAPDADPTHRATSESSALAHPAPASIKRAGLLVASTATTLESDGFEWPLPPRECMVSPVFDLPSSSPQTTAPAPTHPTDRPSDRTPPLVDDVRRTSAPNSTSPKMPLTPVEDDDELYRPSSCAVPPPGVGVIGDGRPSLGLATREECVRSGREEPALDKLKFLPSVLGTVQELTSLEECAASDIGCG